MKNTTLLLLAIPAALCAQTIINGSRIIKGSLDASGSTRSLPNRTGTGSPSGRDACASPGETYFQTDAAAGQNLWVCTAAGTPGTWNQISGSGGSSPAVMTGSSSPSGSCSTGSFYLRTDIQELYICSGTNVWELASYASGNTASRPLGCVSGQLYIATDTGDLWYCAVAGSLGTWQPVTPLTSVSLNGVQQGAFSTLNLVNAPGANWTLTPNGQTLTISPTPDTNYLLSQTAAQNGSPFLCAPASNNGSAYSCSLTPAPTALTNGMLVEFRPDVSCAGGATTLNISGLGAKPVYAADGSSNPAANDCRANRPTWLLYSAALNGGAGAFVLQSAANVSALPSTQPAAGQIPIGNAGGTAYAPQTVTGDLSLNSTGAATVGTATNLRNGAAGSIPYQSAAGVTAMLAGNTAATDQVLISHGTGSAAQAPTLSNAPALSMANMTGLTAAQVPTLNQNTTGNAATATLAGNASAVGGITVTGTPSAGQVLTATSASAANWQAPAAGGNASITPPSATWGGTPSSPVTSSSVTFTRTTNIQEWTLYVGANMTSTMTGQQNGDVYTFNICQEGTSTIWTFAWPSGFSQAPAIPTDSGVCVHVVGTWDTSSGTGVFQLMALPSTTETPFLISAASERMPPSTPAPRFEMLWPDSTRLTWTGLNSAGNSHIMPRVQSGNTTDQLRSTDLGDVSGTGYAGFSHYASGSFTVGDCVEVSGTSPVTFADNGSPCGSGSGGGANANATYLVASSSNAPANAVNLGSLSSGILEATVSGGVATLSTASTLAAAQIPAALSNTTSVNGTNIPASATLLTTTSSPSSFPTLNQSTTGNAATATNASEVGGIAVSGTPSPGQVLTATSSTAADWQNPSGGSGGMVYPAAGVANSTGTAWGTSYQVGTSANDLVQLNGSAQLPAVSGVNLTSLQNINSGSSLPGSCSVGQIFFSTSAAAGQNLYFCTSSNTWTQMSGAGTVTETVYIPAANGGTAATSAVFGPGVDGDTNNVSGSVPTKLNPTGTQALAAFNFANDPSTAQNLYATTMLPQNWSSSGPVNITLNILKGTTTGTAEFNVATSCSTALSGPSWNTNNDQGVTVSSGQAFNLASLTFNSVSMSGCSAGSTLQIRVQRNQADTNDNMAGPIYLLGMQVQWQHT